jgi:SAM-dependent methyltransferase
MIESLTSEPELSYFELQAYLGTTKHMGGLETTEELVALCHVDRDACVLDVGCGAGATACYLAREYGCQVIGVDLRESMVALSKERAEKEGVGEGVTFRVADVQALPFEDGLFDAVLCESVATFVEDKRRVINEYARVTKPGGYVGLNEEIWMRPPLPRLIEYVKLTWDIESEVPAADDWVGWLEDAGLRDIVAKTCRFDARRESSQLKRYSAGDIWRMLYRTLSLYARNPDFRGYVRGRRRTPRDLFEYLGYAILVGRR